MHASSLVGATCRQEWFLSEADALEHKDYASGIGVLLEVDLESDERLELISVRLN